MIDPIPRRSASAFAMLLLLALVACRAGGSPSPTTSPAPTPTPSPSTAPSPTPEPSPSPSASIAPSPGALSIPDLQYLLIDHYGQLWYCDPDYYPVSHGDEQASATQHLTEIRADAVTWAAITHRLGIDPAAEPDAPQTLAIYRQWKILNALRLTPALGGFAFDAIFRDKTDNGTGTRDVGTITAAGDITATTEEPSHGPNCPICLARGTLIATPSGEIPVEELTAGMTVWTADPAGARIAAPILLVGSAAVPAAHEVVHLVLDDGRTVDVSPGHPLPDGRRVGDLRPGDEFDGAVVASADLIAYGLPRTFDLLPAGATGTYWAGGILLGSTLKAPNR